MMSERALKTSPRQPHKGAVHCLIVALLAGASGLACLALAATYIYTQSNAFTGGLLVTGSPTPPVQIAAAAVASSRTPFLPQPNTATATGTLTPTATATPTSTFTPSPTPTFSETPRPTETATHTPSQTAPSSLPPTGGLPSEAAIHGVTGYPQSQPLTCESRSAVDWAAYYGLSIGEMTFQAGLPVSDNPNRGFVGSPYDERGQVPPNSYGVHAAPVAALLRAYGLNAQEASGLYWDDVRRSVAAGDPVIVWVIGNVWDGYAGLYTAADGETVTVAAYEHTVIVTAYTPHTVTVVDGGMVYTAGLERFLSSWAVLGNMGIIR